MSKVSARVKKDVCDGVGTGVTSAGISLNTLPVRQFGTAGILADPFNYMSPHPNLLPEGEVV